MKNIFTKQLMSMVPFVVFVLTTSIGLISFPCIAYANTATQGKINQNIAELKQQGVFEKATNVFSATPDNSDDEISKVVTEYTLLSVTNGISEILKTKPEYLKLIIPIEKGSKNLTVLLYKETISPYGFNLLTSGNETNKLLGNDEIVHYRGSIDNDDYSIAAVTFSTNETMGIISNADGNYVLGKIENDVDGKFIIYNDRHLVPSSNFECSTNTAIPEINPHIKNLPIQTTSVKCVKWYWETDYDLYQNKGSLANVNSYMQGLFNQVSTLYANDGISISLKTLFVWTTVDPFTGPNFWGQFRDYRTSFDGDLANIINLGSSGIAFVGSLCHSYIPNRTAYSGISSSYSNVPTYSWAVNVIAHEQGHNLGSPHTHDCAWNGNNTRIDGCYGSATTNCPLPALPTGGGTIMSYCHMKNVGINFSLGFGPQPKALILNKVENATCLSACGAIVPSQPGPISGNTLVCSLTSQTYSISPVSGATGYTWSLPPGWTGSSTTNSITVVTLGSTGGTIWVSANNASGSSSVRTLYVTLNGSAPIQPFWIHGNATVCPGVNQNYVTTSDLQATNYTWVLPSGWTGSSSTYLITATPGISATSGIISVQTHNSSCSSVVQTFSVTVFPTANAGANQNICANMATLAGNTPATGTGLWTVVSGTATITSPSSPASAVTGIAVGSNILRWTISNGACGTSYDDVIITRSPAISITGGAYGDSRTFNGETLNQRIVVLLCDGSLSGQVSLKAFLSENNTLDASDVLADQQTPALNVGTTTVVNYWCPIPASWPLAQQIYVIVTLENASGTVLTSCVKKTGLDACIYDVNGSGGLTDGIDITWVVDGFKIAAYPTYLQWNSSLDVDNNNVIDGIDVTMVVNSFKGVGGTGCPPGRYFFGQEREENILVYPNPYNDKVNIAYLLSESAEVSLEVFNNMGQRVAILKENSMQETGQYQYSFSAKSLGYPAGIYILRLTMGEQKYLYKLVEIK